MPRPDTPGGETRARRWGTGGGVAVLVGVAVVLFAASIGIGGPGSSPAGATGEVPRQTAVASDLTARPANAQSAAGTLTAAGSQTQPLRGSDPVEPLSELPPVSLTDPVAPVPGVVFGLEPLRSISISDDPDVDAETALRVSVVLRNDTPDAVDLHSVQVDLSAGAEQLRISGRPDADGRSFPDSLPAGADATADFLFTVPVDQRELVKVCVSYAAGVPVVAFVGAAPS